jgi:hypothetical protein
LQHTSNEHEIDLEAARVAMVALFGFVPPYETVDERHVRIAPDTTLLTVESALRFLASMPKPLICAAAKSGGTLKVTCELVVAADGAEREILERRLELRDEGGALFDDLVDRYGDDHHRVMAFGRKSSVVVSLAGARRWHRDYMIDFVSWRADDAGNSLATSDAQYEEARRVGARGILQFFSPAERVVTSDGTSFPFPLPDSATNDERMKLEKAMIERARSRLVAITEEEDVAAVERQLVERGEIPADSFASYAHDRESLGDKILSSQLQQFFRDKAMPPEVVAFVDACRAG